MSPYRTPLESEAHEPIAECPDRDLLPVLALFWIGSVARVAVAFVDREGFGTEATLALVAVVFVPFQFRHALSWWRARRRRQRRDDNVDAKRSSAADATAIAKSTSPSKSRCTQP
jgi:hypothetical protein